MEPKDYVLAAGVVVTLFLGVWNAVVNYRWNQRTSFINTITSQRIKWIEQLRQDIASFGALMHHGCLADTEKEPQEGEMLREAVRLRQVIRLRLNPTMEPDKTIERLVGEIPRQMDSTRQPHLAEALEELTRAAQVLIKQEWEKVKAESKYGDLSQRV